MNDIMVKQLREKATAAGQGHIFRFWDELSAKSRERLVEQIQSIDFELLNRLKNDYLDEKNNNVFEGELEPPEIFSQAN